MAVLNALNLRWLIRRDLPEVLQIEQQSFPEPWTEEEFLRLLKTRCHIGIVAECDWKIVGFMIYELHMSRLDIHNFAVHPDFRRQYVGHRMVKRLIDKLSPQRRTHIRLHIRETNLEGQLFFRSQGFKALRVKRNFWESEHSTEDAYLMQYSLPLET
jgi:ribosomal-protein-alanine N-acetyltransferase